MHAQLVPTGQDKPLIKGMKISKTTKIKKGVYLINADKSLDRSVILIQGDNITVDFNNITLRGSNSTKNPDEFNGVGILISNSKNVIIKNLKAKGYKIALLAKNTEGLYWTIATSVIIIASI